jgi:PAS domain S-box-containing protein
MNPPIPDSESERLESLRSYRLLDSRPEQDFDDLTELAANICGAPISLVSLVDESRQWFKSKVGFAPSETSRNISFCGHAILEDQVMVVPDAKRDPRFASNPMVLEEPRVQFYAGAPLVNPQGHALGALCVMDRVPRELTRRQLEALKILSRQVVSQMELRKRAWELAASEERLRVVTQNARVGLVVVNEDRRYVYANDEYVKILGLAFKPIVGERVADVLASEYDEQIRPRLDRAFAGETLAYELRREREGREYLYHVTYGLAKTSGSARYVVAVITDISDRLRAEITAKRLAAIVEYSDDAIIGKNLGSIVTSWNRGAERVFGYSADEMVGQSIMRLIPEDRRDEENHILGEIGKGNSVEHFDTIRRTKDGRLINVSVTASPIKDPSGAVIGISKIARDITQRIQSEKARRLSEERYLTLFECAPDGIVIANPNGDFLDANASICQMLGYVREELVGMNSSAVISEPDPSKIAQTREAIRARVRYPREWIFKGRNGTLVPTEVVAAPMPDGNIMGMVRDVTERKKAEARFRRLVESNVQGVMFWTDKGRIADANDAFLEIVGYTRDDLAAGRIESGLLTPPEYAHFDQLATEEVAKRGACTPYEKEFLRKDGTRTPVLVGLASFEDNLDEGVCFVLDLTERKKVEKQFLRAQRMESIGTLAGGIAHDLNNLLAPIVMGVELLRQFGANSQSLPIIGTIEQSANRGVSLVKQVLSFARGVEGSRVATLVSLIMQEVREIADSTFPKNIMVETQNQKDLWMVQADPTQINQVILNLCVNARDAMPNGGRIRLAAKNVEIDQQYAVMNHGMIPGRYVLLEVVDGGTGIPKAIIDRIFEPFFTTKEVGKGTGLGLSTVLGIVRSHGGFVNVYSEPGNGTTFRVYLPALSADSVAGAKGHSEDQFPRGNGEQIMVVDDEASVLDITKQTLMAFGYRVLTAEDGAQAIALYAVHRDEISAVLTDIMMPIMDGSALIAALLRINPKARIIAASGLAANGNANRLPNVGAKHFLAKPYSADALLKVFKAVLSSE